MEAFFLNTHIGSHDINLSVEIFTVFSLIIRLSYDLNTEPFVTGVCVCGLRRDVSCSFKLSWELSC